MKIVSDTPRQTAAPKELFYGHRASGDGKRLAKVYKLVKTNEFVVRFFENGVYKDGADDFVDFNPYDVESLKSSQADAFKIAKTWVDSVPTQAATGKIHYTLEVDHHVNIDDIVKCAKQAQKYPDAKIQKLDLGGSDFVVISTGMTPSQIKKSYENMV